jgi:hypothetical protein
MARTSATFKLIVLSLVVAVAAPLSLYFALMDAQVIAPGAFPAAIALFVVAVAALTVGFVVIRRLPPRKNADREPVGCSRSRRGRFLFGRCSK